MKKYHFLFVCVLALAMSLNLASCGGDDNENLTPSGGTTNTEVDSPEDNLPESARKFVGLWITTTERYQSVTSPDCDFLFLPNGRCAELRKSYNGGGGSIHMDYVGFWTYDEGTRILATTIGKWQWDVTLSNDEAWAGKCEYGNRSYTKASMDEMMGAILRLSRYYRSNENNDAFVFIGDAGYYHSIEDYAYNHIQILPIKQDFTTDETKKFKWHHLRIRNTSIIGKDMVADVDLVFAVEDQRYYENKSWHYTYKWEVQGEGKIKIHNYLSSESSISFTDVPGLTDTYSPYKVDE